MIASMKLKFGAGPGSQVNPIPLTPMTVFVGPNNSGKSLVLRELEASCRAGQAPESFKMVAGIDFSALSEKAISEELERILKRVQRHPSGHAGSLEWLSAYGQTPFSEETVRSLLTAPNQNQAAFCQSYLNHLTLRLDGTTRFNHVIAQAGGDLSRGPLTSLQVLFKDDGRREQVRRIVHEAFGDYFVLDPTLLGQLRIRLSAKLPAPKVEKALDDEALRFFAEARLIDTCSDGVKAFVGIIIEVIAGDPKVLLVDEPEAFLHPSLAHKLGAELSSAASKANKRVFVATHSPNFVMGCVESGVPLTIIRLTHQNGTSTARVLPHEDMLQMMRNPLLRSTGVLGGLFYESVVVTEADADRAFYQEVNDRLVKEGQGRGIPNCLFLNAQNKQTVPTIVVPLRKIGIPAVGIVDIDVLNHGGREWTKFLEGSGIPQMDHQPMQLMRHNISEALKATGRNPKTDGGVSVLTADQRQSATNLLERLEEYGLFVVPGGELESWLQSLKCTGHGPAWLVQIFEKMGADPSSPDYVKPSNDDVWKFMSGIRTWLMNPERKGVSVP
jgi:energy-coupling factor transporter ATP-binding protein EcfA2